MTTTEPGAALEAFGRALLACSRPIATTDLRLYEALHGELMLHLEPELGEERLEALASTMVQRVIRDEGAPIVALDLADLEEVAGESDPPKANEKLAAGWVLLCAGIDANGFPSFVLGRPKGSPAMEGDSDAAASAVTPGG